MAVDRQVTRMLIENFLDQLDAVDRGQVLSLERRLKLSHDIEKSLIRQKVINRAVASQQVTILLADLRGFTQLAESLEAEKLVSLLNRYYTRMTHIVHQHHGVVDKFMGDAIMALFGVPNVDDDDLLHALRCAADMQCVMDEINQVNQDLGVPSLYMGIGVNTGDVVAANMGPASHSEFTVIGDQVNLVSRVEAHCLRGQILLSENSYQLARDFVEVAEPRRVYIKGKHEPVNLYHLKAVTRPQRINVPNREERSGPRVAVDFPFQFNLVHGKGVSEQSYQGHAVDLSYHGLRGRVALPMRQESEFRLSLSNNLVAGATGDIYARVLSSTPKQNEYEVTAEFTSVPSDAERVICHVVDRLVAGG